MLVFLLLLVLLIGFVLLAFPLIIAQATTIAAAMPGYYHGLRGGMAAYPNQWIVRLGAFLPVELPGLGSIQSYGAGKHGFGRAGLGIHDIGRQYHLWRYGSFAIGVLLDAGRAAHHPVIITVRPNGQRESIGELISAMETKVGSYIAGQAVLCLIIGIMALVAYLLIGLPNVLVLALLAGVMEAIPLVGPLLGIIPAGLVALSIGPDKLVWVIVATLVIHQTGKLPAGAARHEQGGRGQPVRFPAGVFCLWQPARPGRHAGGNTDGGHHPTLTRPLRFS